MNVPTKPESGLLPSDKLLELERTCFLIMPFGKKKVGDREVDFTAIYKDIFAPAIAAAKTPEGQALIPARTDMDAFSGSINQEMFEYIMYSRLAFADISGFNPNVFYEIGARHSVQEAGTVLFRQVGHAIPFDITTIKVFEYDDSGENLAPSCEFITNVLTETLRRNRLDSPVRLALRAQYGGREAAPPATSQAGSTSDQPTQQPELARNLPREEDWRKQAIERFMRDAEEALRFGDLELARANYWGALRFDPLNIIARMRLGLVFKRQGRHYEALEEFTTVTKLAPTYGEAWKEKGVVEGRIARLIPPDKRNGARWLQDGYASLDRARMLIPEDFDVWSSLGGVLKNVRNEPKQALKMYDKAASISDGHPYPLLNALKLRAQEMKTLDIEAIRPQLENARKLREGQALNEPPTDTPWCYFDLAEISLYQGDEQGFLEYVEKGIKASYSSAELETFRSSLDDCLLKNGIMLAGLEAGIALLDKAIGTYMKS